VHRWLRQEGPAVELSSVRPAGAHGPAWPPGLRLGALHAALPIRQGRQPPAERSRRHL